MLLIIGMRIVDVSMATTRTILLTKGKARVAAIIGFVESLVFVLVLGSVMSKLDNPAYVLAYAGGFALGNFIGSKLERFLAFGESQVRLIIKEEHAFIVEDLRELGYGVTTFEGKGRDGIKIMLLLAIPRKEIPKIESLLKEKNVCAFLTVNDLAQYAGGTLQKIK